MNFFETFPKGSLPSTVSKNTIKMIGHHSRLRDAMGQCYPIYACTRANHARYSSVHVTSLYIVIVPLVCLAAILVSHNVDSLDGLSPSCQALLNSWVRLYGCVTERESQNRARTSCAPKIHLH